MAKEITSVIKLQAPGGKATPAPPIGPALGQHGVNIGQFVSQFNERTKDFVDRNNRFALSFEPSFMNRIPLITVVVVFAEFRFVYKI